MSEAQKQQNFLQGTALLAMATAIVKVIGALYKIPLNAIIGEQGFGYFNTAYETCGRYRECLLEKVSLTETLSWWTQLRPLPASKV